MTTELGGELPLLKTRPPGEHSRTFLVRHKHVAAPMGPPRASGGIVYATAAGANVVDVDGNRYVDLAAGFGAELIGHAHPAVRRALSLQSERLWHALGDVHPSDAKIAVCERLSALHPEPGAQVILGQSGSDAVSAALKTALLATGKPGVVAFGGAYHGLGYGPLAACGLRESYRAPFSAQLNQHVRFCEYPATESGAEATLAAVRGELEQRDVGAVLVEPILGRGGVIVPPAGFLLSLSTLAAEHGALLVADEIWTGLGRAGSLLASTAQSVSPDLICLGKGLGGGLPLSAVVGRRGVMAAWQRAEEVVDTSTFAGAPLACATALATLDTLAREKLVERSTRLGASWRDAIGAALTGARGITVRGAGLMVGVELGAHEGAAVRVVKALLERGYLATTGGGKREVLVLTPPLTITEPQLEAATEAVADAVREAA
ncbi:MAG TPA: aspartate aminotransferase family protein [Polyangiaceae bacterium]|nr:aspartate aminotransferase family protein [Polyangiaceae bacterium]